MFNLNAPLIRYQSREVIYGALADSKTRDLVNYKVQAEPLNRSGPSKAPYLSVLICTN
jgi:hypothetical protein